MTDLDTARLERNGLGQLHETYRKQVNAWIRPEGGRWRFIDNAGHGYWLDADDGAELHAAAHQRVDELFGGLDGSSWLGVIVAAVIGEVVALILHQFGGLPGIVYVLPLGLFLFKDAISEIEYAFATHRLRAQIARELNGGPSGDGASELLFELNAQNLLMAGGGALFVTAGIASLVVADQTMLLKVGLLAGLALAGCGGEKDPGAPDTTVVSADGSAAAETESVRPPVVFAQCASCHSVKSGVNGIGPSLAGVFGRKAGSDSTFSYSDALKNSGLTWDEVTLDRWLTNPLGIVPGTRMTYMGQSDPAKRAETIAYLKTLK